MKKLSVEDHPEQLLNTIKQDFCLFCCFRRAQLGYVSYKCHRLECFDQYDGMYVINNVYFL